MSSSSSRFVVNSNALFICGTGDGAILVIDAGTDLNHASYSSLTWKIVAAITANKLTGATIPRGTMVHRALEIFGTVIESGDLDKLRGELFDSKILVNRDGYQVKYWNKNGNAAGGFVIGGSDMAKLNNLFGWGKYGVKPAMTTVWNRYVARGAVMVDYVAAEERRKETAAESEKQRRKLRELVLRAAEKEEIVGHYKRILEENKEVMWEKESVKERLREVIEEKNRVVEEQSRVIKEKEVEIRSLKAEKKKKIESENGTAGIGDSTFMNQCFLLFCFFLFFVSACVGLSVPLV
ncbi:unnamed protein product [Linum tenue]|uniref:Uncharacterized protein n=2 Tax=Linum tenue TaxID=586396 RepID=A0AAV0KHD4_9ROSI|nr:unnamed protein product [Linum tenue]